MTKIIQRHDTAANWASANPVLAQGEMGIETDTRKFKFGDGTTAWTDLAYASYESGGGGGTSDYNELINKPVVDSTELKGTISLAAPLKIEKSTTDSLYNATINANNQITLTKSSGVLLLNGSTSANFFTGYSNIKINADGTITCMSYVDIPYSIGNVLLTGRGASNDNYFQILFGYKDVKGFRPLFTAGGYQPSNYYTATSTIGDVITRYSTNYFKRIATSSSSVTADTSYTTTVTSAYRKLQLIYNESTGLYNVRYHILDNSTYTNYSIDTTMNELMAKVNTVRIFSYAAITSASDHTSVVVKQLESSVDPFVDMTLNDVLALPNVTIPEVVEHNVLSVGAIPNSYDGLEDKPKLNGNVLSGDINSTDLNIQRVLTPNGGINIIQNGDWRFFDASYDEITKQITFDRYNLYTSNDNNAGVFSYALNDTSGSASKIGTYVDSTKLIPTCGAIMPFYKNVTWKFGYANYAPGNKLVFGNYVDGYFYPKYVVCPCHQDAGTGAYTNFKKITSISQNSSTVFNGINLSISSTTTYTTINNPIPMSAIGIFYDNNTYTFDFNATSYSSAAETKYRRRKVIDSSETAGLDSCTHCWYIPNTASMGMSAGTQLATGDFCAKALIGNLSDTDMNDALILPNSGSNVFTTSISVKTDGVTTRVNESGELEAIAPANMITTDNIASDTTIVGMNDAIEMAQGDITSLSATVDTKANVADLDGTWIKNKLTIASNVALDTTVKNYSLADYLPNDGNIYEVIVHGTLVGKSTGYSNFIISSQYIDSAEIISCATIASTAQTQSSVLIIPIGTDRNIGVKCGSTNSSNGNYYLNAHAYRKVR